MTIPPFIQSFIDGPKMPKVILGSVGVAVIVIGGWFLLLAPVQAEITTLADRRQQLATELTLARTQVAELQRFRKEMAELQVKLDLLRTKLPTEKETPGLYKAVNEAAQAAGLGVSLFQPREPKPKDYVFEIPITVTAEGGYHQLAEMKLIGLTKSRSALRAELTLATYMYRDGPTAAKPGAPAGTVAPKPAAALPSKQVNS